MFTNSNNKHHVGLQNILPPPPGKTFPFNSPPPFAHLLPLNFAFYLLLFFFPFSLLFPNFISAEIMRPKLFLLCSTKGRYRYPVHIVRNSCNWKNRGRCRYRWGLTSTTSRGVSWPAPHFSHLPASCMSKLLQSFKGRVPK
jgi:hypothetical protein